MTKVIIHLISENKFAQTEKKVQTQSPQRLTQCLTIRIDRLLIKLSVEKNVQKLGTPINYMQTHIARVLGSSLALIGEHFERRKR